MTTDDRHDESARTRPPRRAGRVLGAAATLALTISVGAAVIVRTNGGDRGTAAPPSPVPSEASTSTAHTTSPPPAQLAPAGSAATDPTTTTGPPPTTVAPATTAAVVVPEPILVVFDGERVTLDGAVPSEDARSYLETLAAANAKGPATIDNRLTIDPSVPLTVPVRVIELQSARFPSGSAEIVPEHAAELDRVANIMLAFPSLSLLVVGHADQVGADAANLQLSQARAGAVVTYLVSRGVAVDRLSARGVGETDLLADDLGDDALALNRRTEFVFTGILAP